MKGIEELSKQPTSKIDLEECKRREESLTDGQIMDELNDNFEDLINDMVHDDNTIPMGNAIEEDCVKIATLVNELRIRMARRKLNG